MESELSCPRDSHARTRIEEAFRTLHADCRDRNQFQADQELRESLRLQESNAKDMVVGIESQQGYAAKTVQAFCTKGGTLLNAELRNLVIQPQQARKASSLAHRGFSRW